VKIVYLVPESGISGGQRVIFQQAEELARRGLAVTIVSPSPPPDWFRLKGAHWEQAEFSRSQALSRADIRVATFWTTVASATREARGPVFHLCQGYEADFTFYAHQREEIRAAYARPTRKLAVAPHIEERLREEGYSPVTLIGQTFDQEEFPVASDRRFDSESPTILLVGTFEADVKGIREALEALGTARAGGLKFRLRRISATPAGDEERAFGLADQQDVGLLPPAMSAAYRSADLLIGPNHTEEGFGLPVLEALSSGLPVFLSDTPGHRAIARGAAAYFSCGNTSAILSGLGSILRDPPRRRRLSELGPREAARFRTTEVVDRLLFEFERSIRFSEESPEVQSRP
jgi:glycosyltransferase involved in cell wall biosynthesis